ncbi:hypothetical protein, partial [Staphylococcus capitis]|uniref:hypothetical protein n=1 Tax=Staphylococcus capitis TaxID=29388 RepID=UPI001C92ED30
QQQLKQGHQPLQQFHHYPINSQIPIPSKHFSIHKNYHHTQLSNLSTSHALHYHQPILFLTAVILHNLLLIP